MIPGEQFLVNGTWNVPTTFKCSRVEFGTCSLFPILVKSRKVNSVRRMAERKLP